MSHIAGTEPPNSPFFTCHEAAIYLRVEPRTLDNWRSSGIGPTYRKHGGRVVYHIDELIKYSKTVSVSGEQ